ncbi:DUF2809 domain-containing protein [Pseudomonas aeruginosa]|nr:DUF2809 domain-containing protein [Pseudomonas aeruginosa]MDI2462184.1 DUF2809 domain-containing protein [Pseudomonas aeruginosa]
MPALPASPVRSRRWRLDRRSLLLALLLFGLLVLLATLGRHWGWIRSFGGDLLAVVWLYYLMGSALRAPAAWLASAAFAVGALLELGQSTWRRTCIGNSPAPCCASFSAAPPTASTCSPMPSARCWHGGWSAGADQPSGCSRAFTSTLRKRAASPPVAAR